MLEKYFFPHLSYKNYFFLSGPAFWKKFFPECGGTRQSPIDILNGDASYRRELTPIDVSWYKIQPGPDKRFLLKNTGHSGTYFKDLSLNNSIS